ncbi:uncharacterized protein LOC143536000 [Bidens hawaiensis]|uniref:uncharacterized protein LOC143536000 n=1 Tax=Bidens hawaiensis TaxID=980011 RepID=UPI00404A983A
MPSLFQLVQKRALDAVDISFLTRLTPKTASKKMDRDDWMYRRDRTNATYMIGVQSFLKAAKAHRWFALKSKHRWSDKSFTDALVLLHDMLPDCNELPVSLYQAKKLTCPMGLKVKRIHACPNDYMLYTKEFKDDHKCFNCGASRYKRKNETGEVDDDVKKNGPPAKMLWYFPIIPRLKRLFANEKEAKLLRWHSEDRINDGKLRHVADSPQWRNIDYMYPEFGNAIRSIRFGLSSDGINPFGQMSNGHSTWPVLLCIYNLPPWLCMKKKYIMMSLLIASTKQPGNDIDVYLSPLIDDLKKLWSRGVNVYDSYKKEYFILLAMIFCTISDFPAYSNLLGYSTKGYKACPVCEDDTSSIRLKNCRKIVYMGHRRFLPPSHRYRNKKREFNGKTEHEEHLQVRHCLDVMHIEKNVCDSLIGLLLNIPGKTKDGIEARRDMQEMGIREELAPVPVHNGFNLPPACYTMSKKEKKCFANAYTSHDCHVLMTHMIPIAIRGLLLDKIRHTITKLCLFFNMIHSKVIDPQSLDSLQKETIMTLCELEIYMGFLKAYVRNRNRPEGSIVEGYTSEEVTEFCIGYLDGVNSIGVPQSRHLGRLEGKGGVGMETINPTYSLLQLAHFIVLKHMT